jgi:hypothetical protein
MTDFSGSQQNTFPTSAGVGPAEGADIWPFRSAGDWAGAPADAPPGGDVAGGGDAREKAAGLIAEALLRAEEMVAGPAREMEKRMVDETIGGLRALAEHLERCVGSLSTERTELENELEVLRGLVADLSEAVRSLRAGGPVAATADAAEPAMAWPMDEAATTAPADTEASIVEAPPPPPTFPANSPVSVQVQNVSNFNLLVRLERILSSHDAVQSAGIESYQEEQARFVLALKEPATGEEIQQAIERDLGHQVSIEKADPEWSELVLRLEPATPPPADSWMAGPSGPPMNGSW